MTPRVFAILVCLVASWRWPRLRYVVAALGCESALTELVPLSLTTPAMIAWLAPSIGMTSLGVSFATCRRWPALAFAVCQGIAYAFAGTQQTIVAAIATSSFVAATAQLIRRASPADIERSTMLALLAGNTATFALMLLFGVDRAYASGVVSTSNELTHIAIAGLVLWAMRR